jgi:hypothetical protein
LETQVLLPLFAQLDLPSEEVAAGVGVGGGEEEEEGEDAVRLFDLLGKCLAQRYVVVGMHVLPRVSCHLSI